MVLRTSNGYPFTVLDPVPSLRTGIKVAIYDRDDPATLVDILPDSRARKWIDELNDVGAGEFEIHEDDPKLDENPGILRPGNFARFYLDEVARFTIRLEDYDYLPASDSEDSGRWIKVSGRGAGALLEDGVVYPEGSLAGDPDRDTTGLTPGEAFIVFKDEADVRNSVAQALTPDFTDTLDSSNQPYNFTLAESARAGRDDLLKLVQRYAELGVDFDITPDLQLKFYANGLGVDKTIQTVNTAPVILRIAHNIRNLKATETALIKNALLGETPAGFFERVHSGSITDYLRREGYISLGNTTDGDYIDRATDAAFARLADIQTAITVEVLDIEGHRPYVDYGKGDWVLAPNAQRELIRWRVRGVTISETDEGTPLFIPTINSVDAELEERLQKWMRTMTPGTLGGTVSDVASPNTATVAGAADAAQDKVDEHEAAHPHFDELSDLTDVDVTGLEDGDLLVYDSGAGDWVPLDFKIDLSTPPANNQILRYDSGSNTWEPDDESGGGGGGGSDTFLDSDKSSTDDPPDDEFDDTSGMSGATNGLDAKWTLIGGASEEAVDLLEIGNVLRYDLATIPGKLLMQAGTGSGIVALRQDLTLADGEGLVVAFSPGLADEWGNNDIWCGLSLNTNDSDPHAGTYASAHIENNGEPSLLLYTGAILFDYSFIHQTTIFVRVHRVATEYFFMYSFDGNVWSPMDSTSGTEFTNLWIFTESAGFTGQVPISMFHWIRKTESNGFDPWTWRS